MRHISYFLLYKHIKSSCLRFYSVLCIYAFLRILRYICAYVHQTGSSRPNHLSVFTSFSNRSTLLIYLFFSLNLTYLPYIPSSLPLHKHIFCVIFFYNISLTNINSLSFNRTLFYYFLLCFFATSALV